MALIRISPDGKEVVCLHNDFIHKIVSKHADVEIKRATDVYYDNAEGMWRVKLLDDPFNGVLPVKFPTRAEAIQWEVDYLEHLMRQTEGT